MLSWLRRRRRRRILRPVVQTLPWALAKAYGAADYYSPKQIQRILEKSNLDSLRDYALSAYCRATDIPVEFNLSENNRLAYRAELAELFDISPMDFVVENIRRLKTRPSWNPTEWWHSDATLYGTDHGNGPGQPPG
jgi:hypothetical protein